MADNIVITQGADHHHKEIIIKIDLEEVFNKRQNHPEDCDPGTVIYYVIRVDKQQFERKEHELTGRQILALVGLTPDKHRLFELGEGQREVQPDEMVDFKKPGIERFKSVARHANEGKENGAAQAAPVSLTRKAVTLLPDDEKFLNMFSCNWETVKEGNVGWILIPDFDVPPGYNVTKTCLALMIPGSYPTVEFDMMYFFPALSRSDGKAIRALSNQALDKQIFQRWSRHRNQGDWRPGVDNLEDRKSVV